MKRFLLAAFLGVATLISSCGGGGGGCEQTGAVTFAYSPSVEAGGGSRLTYRLQQSNQWTLNVRGVTSECLSGLRAVIKPGSDPLPSGFTLNELTGAISTGVLTSDVEGYCGDTNSYSVDDVSQSRTCPAGQVFHPHRFVLLITSDKVNNQTQVPATITFEPAP